MVVCRVKNPNLLSYHSLHSQPAKPRRPVVRQTSVVREPNHFATCGGTETAFTNWTARQKTEHQRRTALTVVVVRLVDAGNGRRLKSTESAAWVGREGTAQVRVVRSRCRQMKRGGNTRCLRSFAHRWRTGHGLRSRLRPGIQDVIDVKWRRIERGEYCHASVPVAAVLHRWIERIVRAGVGFGLTRCSLCGR